MIQGKAKRKFYFFCCGILSVINKFVPKNKKEIFFFSTTNLYDNSEALFNFFVSNGYNKKYKIVCAVKQPSIYKDKKIENVKFISVFLSVWHIFRAKYIFYHNEMLAIMPTKKQFSVDFWHATTFKKINKTIDPDYRYDFFTYITATSELFRPVFAESFGCEPQRVIINGHPRNDYLFSSENEFKKLGIDISAYEKTVIWVPTYRLSYNEVQRDTDWENLTESGLPVFKTVRETDALNEFLKRKNILLIIKLHPAQNTERFDYTSRSNIVFINNLQLDKLDVHFYALLKDTDALITDYSSVFFDYLLLDKPIAFTIDDINSYKDNRGFVFENPLEYMPGKHIVSSDDFRDFLTDVLDGKDEFRTWRAEINDKVNFYKDGNNSKRITEIGGIEI